MSKAKKKSVSENTEEPMVRISPNFTRSSDFKTIYVNFVQSGMTPFDVSLMIGENHGVNIDQTAHIELKAQITMAPLEAKIVARILADSVSKYENQFGEINVPAGMITGLEDPTSEGV